MTRPKLDRRRSLMDRIWHAQDKHCSLCGEKMYPGCRNDTNRGWSLDHVWPRSLGYSTEANVLLAHKGCNNRKGDSRPTGCEMILLETVNARLGADFRIRSWRDSFQGPSPLAVALQEALAA